MQSINGRARNGIASLPRRVWVVMGANWIGVERMKYNLETQFKYMLLLYSLLKGSICAS